MALGHPVPLVTADEVNRILPKLFLAGKEKARWVTLWRWKIDVQVQGVCFKQEELAGPLRNDS